MSPFRHEPHRWVKWKAIPWQLCAKCGLVRLHNRLTDFCVAHGCNAQEHHLYEREVKR